MGSVGMRIASSNSRSSSLSSGVTGVWCAASAAASSIVSSPYSPPPSHLLDALTECFPSRDLRIDRQCLSPSMISSSVMITVLRIRTTPGLPSSGQRSRFAHSHYVTTTSHRLVYRRVSTGYSASAQVRSPPHVEDVVNDLLVVPACRELGLAGHAGSVPMPAATAWLAIEYVGGPFRGDVNVLGLRPVLGINRIPPRTIPVGRLTAIISRLTPQKRPGAPRSTPRDYATRAAPAASREHRRPAPAARAGRPRRSRRSRRQAGLMPSPARSSSQSYRHHQATATPGPFPEP